MGVHRYCEGRLPCLNIFSRNSIHQGANPLVDWEGLKTKLIRISELTALSPIFAGEKRHLRAAASASLEISGRMLLLESASATEVIFPDSLSLTITGTTALPNNIPGRKMGYRL